MHSSSFPVVAVLGGVLGWFVGSVVAQQPPASPAVAEAIVGSFGVSVHDGVPHAGGPRYSTRFLPSGPVYTPLLGQAARASEPGPVDLQFTFLEARVGGEVLAIGRDEAPQVAGSVVTYARGAVVETYEARADGVEQSFVLAERPAVAGDLVVRGRITTALPLVANGDDEVRFAAACGAGVSFGAVTGIDADGATVRGAMRCRGDELELTLPASFVQSASYPLVLDPLVGTAFLIGDDPLYADVRPAIAYDAGTSRFLVVWAVDVPASFPSPALCQIRGQFVNAGGGAIGNPLLLTTTAASFSSPKIAAVNASDRFLVAWSGENVVAGIAYAGIYGRSVAASNGAMSNVVALQAPLTLLAGIDRRFGLGGDARTGAQAGTRALLACRRFPPSSSPLNPPTSNDILALRVYVPASGDPVPEAAATIASTSNLLDDVTVSAHCGTAGRWGVVFGQSVTSMAGPMQRLYVQVVAASGALCDTPASVVNYGSTGDVDMPAVATRDGSEFVFAWHDAIASTVQVRRGVVGGACGSTSWVFDPIVSPLTAVGPAQWPSLAFVREKYLLVYEQYQSGWQVFARALDPATCAVCGQEQRVDSGPGLFSNSVVASAFEGGDANSDLALVAWDHLGRVRARNWELHGSLDVVGLGGGCGVVGFNDFATYDGRPQLGDSTFAATLLSPTAPVLGLIVGFSQVAVPCGPCTLVAAPDVVLASAGTVPIPIPCDANLIGAELYTQWLQFRASGCPITPTLSLSNGLKFTITE